MSEQRPCATCPSCPDGRITLMLWPDYNLWSCVKCGRRWRLPRTKRPEGSRPLTQEELREDLYPRNCRGIHRGAEARRPRYSTGDGWCAHCEVSWLGIWGRIGGRCPCCSLKLRRRGRNVSWASTLTETEGGGE